MKKLMFALMAALIVSPVFAGPTFTFQGNTFTAVAEVKLQPTIDNSPGGAFSVDVITGNLRGMTGKNVFTTFCIEKSVGTRTNTKYWATIDQRAFFGGADKANDGPGDVISNVTENIYDKWLANGYAKTNVSQTAVSQAIWCAEDEMAYSSITAGAKTVYNNAVAAVGTVGNASHTWALNLWTLSDKGDVIDVQSQLITVPAPGAILLSSLGTVLVGWIRRRSM